MNTRTHRCTKITHRKQGSAAWRTVLTQKSWTKPAASTLTMLQLNTLHIHAHTHTLSLSTYICIYISCTTDQEGDGEKWAKRSAKLIFYRDRLKTQSKDSNTERKTERSIKWLMCFKVRYLWWECEGKWRKERQSEMKRGRSVHGVPRVSSPVMTEQQPHHDGAPVPMTTPAVRWREEQRRDAGEEGSDGWRWKHKDERGLLTGRLLCRSAAKVCLTWLQHLLLAFPFPLSPSSSSSPTPVL